MAINITNIVDAINAKNTNADSNTSDTEIRLINTAITLLNSTDGVITYKSRAELPAPDSDNNGQFIFIPASNQAFVDSYGDGIFYWSSGDSWNPLQLTKEVDAAAAFIGAITEIPSRNNMGVNTGYTSGGRDYPNTSLNVIQKWPFAADGTSTDVGDLTQARYQGGGSASATHGYYAGGTRPSTYNIIDKFPMIADANATDVGNLTRTTRYLAGSSSLENGYALGGNPLPSSGYEIGKYSFSTDGNSTDVGNLTVNDQYRTGTASSTHGYVHGGTPPQQNIIEKFSFSADGNATDVGNLTSTTYASAGSNSDTHGYRMGGYPLVNTIDKYSFATDGNATDAGDLIRTQRFLNGTSSASHGYAFGGQYSAPGPAIFNSDIQKFEFASDGDATDVGDLLDAIHSSAQNQAI